jgi:hypothetical protein
MNTQRSKHERSISVCQTQGKIQLIQQSQRTLAIVENLNFLENQINLFQKIKFPKLQLPNLKKQKKRAKHVKQKSCQVSPCKEPDYSLSFQPTPLPDLHFPSIQKVALGPGCYPSIQRDDSRVFISKKGRHESNFEDQLSLLLSKAKSCENTEKIKNFFKINKEFLFQDTELKEILEKQKEKFKEIQSKIKKKTKNLLEENEKQVKKQKYLEKVEKNLWKRKIPEFKEFAQIFYLIFGVFQISSLIKLKVTSRKVMKS